MSKLETIKELVEQMPESPERQKALQAYRPITNGGNRYERIAPDYFEASK